MAERLAFDAYATPSWVVRRLLEVCKGASEASGEAERSEWGRGRAGRAEGSEGPERAGVGPAVPGGGKARCECPKADLVFLLRLGFLASFERVALWKDLGEPDLRILPNRPSYTGGGTDKYDYAWYIWPPNNRLHGRVSHLAETSLAERKRG